MTGWANVPWRTDLCTCSAGMAGGELGGMGDKRLPGPGGAVGAVPLPDGQTAGTGPLTAGEIARYVVAAAVWAPSVHNTQPWRFTAGGRQISVHADAGRQLMVADPDGREMMISCGAALFTARLALRSLGYIPRAAVLPDPGQPLLVARLSWQQQAAGQLSSAHLLLE